MKALMIHPNLCHLLIVMMARQPFLSMKEKASLSFVFIAFLIKKVFLKTTREMVVAMYLIVEVLITQAVMSPTKK